MVLRWLRGSKAKTDDDSAIPDELAVGFGDEASAEALQQWWLDHPLPPRIGPALLEGLDPSDAPVGAKLLFGGTSEGAAAGVSVGGERHAAASEALAALDWPRLTPPAFLRCYCLLLHPAGP